MAFVISDCQYSMSFCIIQGIEADRRILLLHFLAEFLMAGNKHPGIECDSHALDAQPQHSFNVFCLQYDIGRHLGFFKHFVSNGANPVSLVNQKKRAISEQGQIRVLF